MFNCPNARHRPHRGFTFIEIMLVLLLFSILLLFALPSWQEQAVRRQVREALAMINDIKTLESQHYRLTNSFPVDNASAGLPASDKFVGLYVREIRVENGAIHIAFGNRGHARLQKQILSLRPAIVLGEPLVPIAWICGRSRIPDGMTTVGTDRTTLPNLLLPLDCRG
ncbi:MAG: pilin [Zoogloeaceae bacterium]|jgi:type IV pilus assembly protein PilA|nr:pilin [Zoogloeaceae bacterium]